MYVARVDAGLSTFLTAEQQKEYLFDKENFSRINQKGGQDPSNAWTAPFVPGHKYMFHIGQYGNDFLDINFQLSEHWNEWDKNTILMNNFTDRRDKYQVFVDGEENHQNGTLVDVDVPDSDNNELGHWIYWNLTQDSPNLMKQYRVLVNGKNKKFWKRREIKVKATRCIGPCQEGEEGDGTFSPCTMWTNPSSWKHHPGQKVPVQDENVEIPTGKCIIYDVEGPSPIFRQIQIRGKLQFKDKNDRHLRCKNIFNHGGHFFIGEKEAPFQRTARITLYGSREEHYIVYDSQIDTGNKLLSNIGVIRFYGKARNSLKTRLHVSAFAGTNEITVAPELDLVKGDRLALAATGYGGTESEDVIVEQYDAATGVVGLKDNLKFFHWGLKDTTDQLDVDMRGEVALLSRNIIIEGDDSNDWGGQILTGSLIEYINGKFKQRSGQTIMDHVEVYRCSQADSWRSAVRFSSATGNWSSITNSAIHNGLAWGVYVEGSSNVNFENNVVYSFRNTGINLSYAKNITVNQNWVFHIVERPNYVMIDDQLDFWTGIATCTMPKKTSCVDIEMQDNVVAGAVWAGFTGLAHRCGEDKT